MKTHAKPKSGDTYLGIGPQHHYQKNPEDSQECNCNVTAKSQRHFLHAQSFPKERLTPEHAISYCLRFTSEHWDAEPVDIDIGSKTDDAEVEEYGKLEEDPGLRGGSSFVPLLLNVLVKVGATGLFTARWLVRYRLCHLTRI